MGVQNTSYYSLTNPKARQFEIAGKVASDGTEPPISNYTFAPTWLEFVEQNSVLGVPQTLNDLIDLYLRSRHHSNLAETSKQSYEWLFERVREKFGHIDLGEFGKRGARTAIRQWRDSLMSHPTSADRTIGVLRMVLNFAVNEEYLTRSPLMGIGTVHKGTRRDIIWSDDQIAQFLAEGPRHLCRALLLAVWTGQRQSDLLSLKWTDYDGKYIRLQQKKLGRGKTGRYVKVLVSEELREVLSEIEAEQILRSSMLGKGKVERPLVILTTERGIAWRKGFKSAWRHAIAKVGITGVTFHDLRGTFVTLAHRAGASIREISEATGHDEKHCEYIIRRHYLSSGAEQVISRLEYARKKFSTISLKQIGDEGARRCTGPRRPRAGSKVQFLRS